jgi:hypothetical protein
VFLCVILVFCCITSFGIRMNEKLLVSLLVCAMSVAVFGSTFALSVSSQQPNPCHEQGRHGPLPGENDHQCCTVGHDRAMPRGVVDLRALLALIVSIELPVLFFESSRSFQQLSSSVYSVACPSSPPLRL